MSAAMRRMRREARRLPRFIRWCVVWCASAGAAIVPTRLLAQTTLSPIEQKIRETVTKSHEQAVSYLQKTVNIPSNTLKFTGVKAVGMLFKASLDSLGFSTKWVTLPAEVGRAGHLVAEHKGKPGAVRIMLIGHLDTVVEPDGPTWVRTDSIAKGVGSGDIKGGDVVILYALKALQAAGSLRDMNISIIFTGDEEHPGEPLALDRKAFIDIINQGDAQDGGTMQPVTDGVWGLPPDMLHAIPGYGPDVEKNRNEARALMEKAGYGPNNRLKLRIATRGISLYKDPAVILAGQLKEIYVDADVDIIETAQWYPKVARKDYQVGLNTTGNGVDDPDQNYYENFSCKSERNYTGYCNPEIEKLFDVQSQETDLEKRKKVVWEIDSKLLEDGARPIVMWNRASICMQPYVKGYVANVNSVYNGFRFEDVWIDK